MTLYSQANSKPSKDDAVSNIILSLGFVPTSAKATEQVSENRKLHFHELVELLSTAHEGPKDGPYILRGPCLGQRSDKNMSEAFLLVVDGDSSFDPSTGEVDKISAPTIDVAHNALKQLGLLHAIHTSHSHMQGNKGNRWRAYIVASRAYTKPELAPLTTALHKQMQKNGCHVGQTNESGTFAQPWYLPRRASADALFECHSFVGKPFDVDAAVGDSSHDLETLPPDLLAKFESLARRPRPAEITAFLKTYPLADMLKKYGYTKSQSHHHHARWIHPNSLSGSPGLTVSSDGNICFSHNDNDLLCDGHAHDAFDVFRMLEHGGDMAAALKAAATMCGVKKPSQSSSLLGIVTTLQEEGMELFHDPSGVGFATVSIDGINKTLPIRGSDFRNLLRRTLYKSDGRSTSVQALDDALGTVEGIALFDGQQHEVNLRTAVDAQGCFWLDLGNEAWQSVKITADGWEVVKQSGVKWRRPGGMRPLPVPIKSGNWRKLFELIPLPEHEQILVIAWLLMAFNPSGPYPLLILQGEQGTGKSVLTRILRGLIDPNVAPIRTVPRNEHDLIIAANCGWVIAIDNLSGVQPWLSDGLCRLSTGGGFAARSLYSNDDEHIIEATRPCIINGIDDMAARPDLADRAIILNLEPISKSKRLSEKKLFAAYEAARPAIMGVLLDAASTAIRMLPHTSIDDLPRMADFALFVTAAESALWEQGTFMRTYSYARDDVVAAGLDGSPIVQAIRQLMVNRTEWTGTATYLLSALQVDEQTRRLNLWPKTARALSNALRRIAPPLRSDGIDISFQHGRERIVVINKLPAAPISVTKEKTINFF